MSLLSLSRKQQPQFRTPPSPRTSLSFFSFTTMGHQPSKDALTLYYNQDSSAAASYIAASHAGLKVNVVFVPLPTKPLADGTFIRRVCGCVAAEEAGPWHPGWRAAPRESDAGTRTPCSLAGRPAAFAAAPARTLATLLSLPRSHTRPLFVLSARYLVSFSI